MLDAMWVEMGFWVATDDWVSGEEVLAVTIAWVVQPDATEVGGGFWVYSDGMVGGEMDSWKSCEWIFLVMSVYSSHLVELLDEFKILVYKHY